MYYENRANHAIFELCNFLIFAVHFGRAKLFLPRKKFLATRLVVSSTKNSGDATCFTHWRYQYQYCIGTIGVFTQKFGFLSQTPSFANISFKISYLSKFALFLITVIDHTTKVPRHNKKLLRSVIPTLTISNPSIAIFLFQIQRFQMTISKFKNLQVNLIDWNFYFEETIEKILNLI